MSEIPIEKIPASVISALKEIIINDFKFINYKYYFEPGSNVGDGYIGIVSRARIEGKRDDGKIKRLSLICKYQSNDKVHCNKFNSGHLFAREVFVYTKVLPAFEKIQEEYGISQEDGYFAYPKCYHASVNGDDIVLIFEDLSARNFVMEPNENKYDIEHVQQIYSQLGRFHALSFAIRYHKPEVFETFKQLDDLLHMVMTTEDLQPIAKKNVRLTAAMLNDGEVQLKEKVLKYENCLWDEMYTKALQGHLAEPYAVVNHGDCWTNNLMYRYENDIPKELIMIDYQHTRYCSPAIDVIYFPFLCATEEFRNQYNEHLINVYYKSLAKLLRQLGGDPEKLFPFHVLREHLKKFGIIGFGMGTYTTPLNCKIDVDNIDENSEAFKEYKIRMAGIVRDVQKFGYFDV